MKIEINICGDDPRLLNKLRGKIRNMIVDPHFATTSEGRPDASKAMKVLVLQVEDDFSISTEIVDFGS